MKTNLKSFISNTFENAEYILFGLVQVINGHYTFCVLNYFDNNWYFFNDDKEAQKISKEDEIKQFNPMFLFYYKNNNLKDN